MNYVGDYSSGATVIIYFNTFDSNDPSASVTMTNFINTDVHIHRGSNLTQRNNAAGITVDVDVDAITGTHFIEIDTADNTVADFYQAGFDYNVRIEGTTVDAATVNAVVGSFSIENRHVAGVLQKTRISALTSQTSFTLAAGSADADAYNGCTIIVSDIISAVQKCVGLISDYTVTTRVVTLAEDPGIFTMAVGDNVSIIATSALANVRAINTTLQTAGDVPALVTTVDTVVDGIQTDLDNGTDGLGAIKTETALIVADTNELQGDWVNGGRLDLIIDAILVDTGTTLDGRLPAALVDGRMDSNVQAMATAVIGADQIATNAIGAAELALDAGQEIADRILARNIAGGSDTGRIVTDALRILRNRVAIAAGTMTVYEEDDLTSAWTATISTTAGDPVSESNPA